MRRFTLYCAILLGVLVASGGILHAQGTYKVRGVHLMKNATNLDFFLNNQTPATIGDLPFEYASALGQGLPAGQLNVKVAPAGLGIAGKVIEQTITGAGNMEYSAVAYGTLALPKLKILARSRTQVPSNSTRSLIRFFDASSVPAAFDIYLDSTSGTPLFSSVTMDSVTAFKEIPGIPATFIVTMAGSKTPIVRLEAPIPAGTYLTFIGTGTGPGDFKVYMLDEKDPNTDFRKLVILQGREGLQPTLRVVHAVPQSSVRLVDVYLDNATTPRTVGMHYRSATPLYQPAVDSTTIRFTPYQLPPAQAFLTSGIPLNTDTGYVTILTQFRNGSITSYNLTRYLQMPPTGATNTRVRVTNATDFFGDPSEPALNLSFVMTPEGASPIQIDMLGFEKTTEWYEIPAGPVGIKAYRSGVAAPVFEGTYTVDPMKDYTFIALGTDASLSIDVLDQTLFGEQKPLGSFGPQETGVRTGAELAVAQLLTSPNPFAGSASLSFTTSHAGHVMVELYDALGQITRRPVDDWRAQGTHSARIDADGLPAGRYHVVLRVDERIEAMGEVVVIR